MSSRAIFSALNNLAPSLRMPVLFLGHGSPMNAIEENEFVQGFRKIGESIATPKAILCISAHWETRGIKVTAMEKPRTIHDFYGFPEELFAVEYPAAGDPELAKSIQALATSQHIALDHEWGLDHGTWSVVKHLYPKADIPVLQLSLNRNMDYKAHIDFAKELGELRQKGVLIIGSGNMVHNLRLIDWKRINESDFSFDWAEEASCIIKKCILDEDLEGLATIKSKGKALELAIPTDDHYLPLLYSMALKSQEGEIEILNDKAVGGSLTMTSLYLT